MGFLDEEPVQTETIPELLIYETLNGRPLYYKGYRDVLAGTLKAQTIMGSSDLQSIIITILVGTLWNRIDRKTYQLATNESGLHIAIGDNLSADIAIFEKPIRGNSKASISMLPLKL